MPPIPSLRSRWSGRNPCTGARLRDWVGLRSFTASSRILPEQTLGRGLRRMSAPGSGWIERVVVIEHDAFRDLWDSELAAEGLRVQRKKAADITTGATTVFVDEAKVRSYDLSLPALSRAIRRATTSVEGMTLDSVNPPTKQLTVPDVPPEEYIKYRGAT
jgi:type III restriction enzyme